MFDFFIRDFVINRSQKYINRLTPEVNCHLHKSLPLPSIGSIKKKSAVVAKINILEPEMIKLTDGELKAKTDKFKSMIKEQLQSQKEIVLDVDKRYRSAVSGDEREQLSVELQKLREKFSQIREKVLQSILPEAFAVVREAGRRTIGLRHYDVQLIGGMVLHEGNIAEMATGEGKTLVATLAVYLNALTGDGVHVVTVNDYLAHRDTQWMGPVYEFLGLTVGVIQHDMSPSQRQKAYSCDVVYGTNNEFGFDYLRDNMVSFKEDIVQRGHHFAVVDEVDSILVDEARTPLIISGPAEESTDKYYTANNIVRQLKGRRVTPQEEVDAKYKGEDLSKGFDYIADEKSRSVTLTEQGEEKAAKLFGVDNLHDIDTTPHRHHVMQSLRAREFFHRDVDFVVRDGEVIIVDEFTGRMMPGRRWSDGLHQAVEAKEGIKIARENQTLATITFQNYFKMYDKLSGMTGTAHTEASEFKQIYGLDCTVIPTNRILHRDNHPDCIYKTVKEKFDAVVDEIQDMRDEGRPVLVGTISIEKSERLSRLLKQRGIAHQVLNAKYHELEAHIIAQAGRYQAVTIATNMAGRGTDIILGGNAQHLAQSMLNQETQDSEEHQDKEKLYSDFLKKFEEQVKTEHEKVVGVGGLHVIGTGRHESRRIDNQLRGRSGRQGDPGSSRFYVSLEDDLMRLFGSDRIMAIMDKFGMEEGQVIEHPLVTRAIEVAQKRVEGHNFEIRKQLLEYDDIMNKQREVIYNLRRSILEGENIKERVLEAIEDMVYGLIDQYCLDNTQESSWDPDGLMAYLRNQYGLSIKIDADQLNGMNRDEIRELVLKALLALYESKEASVSSEDMRQLERALLLQTIDSKWKDHLYEMDKLKEGVGLRAYGQRDPLVEYQHEAFTMFKEMYTLITQEVANMIFRVQPVRKDREHSKGVFSSLPQEFIHNDFTSLSDKAVREPSHPVAPQAQASDEPPKVQSFRREQPKVGRNSLCPCGSGRKHKKCCGK